MSVKRPIVPPGGFAGFSQQTSAVQALFSAAIRTPTRRKTTRRKKKTTTRRKKAATSRRRSPVRKKRAGKRLVKGSAAAKRHMAKIRKMRRR